MMVLLHMEEKCLTNVIPTAQGIIVRMANLTAVMALASRTSPT